MNNKMHSEETKQKMRHSHRRLKKDFIVWNKGLTKETSEKVRQSSENWRYSL